MATLRAPSAVVIGVATVFFLFYLLPWQNLPSIQIPSPSPASYVSSWRSSVSPSDSLGKSHEHEWILRASDLDLLSTKTVPTGMVTYRAIRDTGVVFNASGSDVLVILHIQKTGGTSFEKHIVQDLDVEKPCICWKRRKRCKCPRPTLSNFLSLHILILSKAAYVGWDLKSNRTVLICNLCAGKSTEARNENVDSWLFSRFSTGWICGLHADWTELTACVDDELSKAHGAMAMRR